MKRVATIAVAIVALMSVVIVTGASGHRVKFDTTVTAKFNKPKKNDPYAVANFDGALSSVKARCVKNRTVNVYLRASDGSTPLVGSDATDATGVWAIQPTEIAAGTYYAETAKKVLRKSSKHKHVCKAGISRDVTVK